MALSIAFLHQLGAAVLLVTLTLWPQYAGFTALIAWIRRAVASDIHELGPFRSAALVVQFTAAVIVPHGLIGSVVGGLLSVALLSVMGICLVLLAKQLCDGRLWRCTPPVGVAHIGAAGRHRRPDTVLFAIVTRLVDRKERSYQPECHRA